MTPRHRRPLARRGGPRRRHRSPRDDGPEVLGMTPAMAYTALWVVGMSLVLGGLVVLDRIERRRPRR